MSGCFLFKFFSLRFQLVKAVLKRYRRTVSLYGQVDGLMMPEVHLVINFLDVTTDDWVKKGVEDRLSINSPLTKNEDCVSAIGSLLQVYGVPIISCQFCFF